MRDATGMAWFWVAAQRGKDASGACAGSARRPWWPSAPRWRSLAWGVRPRRRRRRSPPARRKRGQCVDVCSSHRQPAGAARGQERTQSPRPHLPDREPAVLGTGGHVHRAVPDAPLCLHICFPPAASVDWGDGGSDPNPTITPQNCLLSACSSAAGRHCTFAVSSSHTYAEEGTYTTVINWSVSIPGARGASLGNAFVQDQPLSAGTGPTVTGTEGAVVSAVGSFTDGNTSAPLSDFSVTIDWGDGSTSPGTVSGGGGSYQVSGTAHLRREPWRALCDQHGGQRRRWRVGLHQWDSLDP